jgi:hypothetical protein
MFLRRMQVKDNKQQQLDCNGVKYIYVIHFHDYFESFQSHPKIVILDSPYATTFTNKPTTPLALKSIDVKHKKSNVFS